VKIRIDPKTPVVVCQQLSDGEVFGGGRVLRVDGCRTPEGVEEIDLIVEVCLGNADDFNSLARLRNGIVQEPDIMRVPLIGPDECPAA